METSAPFKPVISVISDDSFVKPGTIINNSDSRGNRGATPVDPNGGSPKGTGSGVTPITVDPSGLGTDIIPNDGNDPTRGLNQGSSASDFIIGWLDSGLWNPFSPYWSPSSESSPEQNLNSLVDWISGILNYYDFSKWNMESVGKPASNSFNYANLLTTIYRELSKDGHPLGDLSDSATIELAEKVSDVTFSFINAQFQQALSYQSWFLQQEYNSPINQVNRLAAAGLSSAFAIGNYSSGNAQTPAGVASVQQPSSSNAGQAEAAENSNLFGFIGQVAGSAVSLIPGVSSLVSAIANRKLTLKQIQKADADIINSAATEEVLRNTVETAKSNVALSSFDMILKHSNSIHQNAKHAVDSAQSAYSSALLQPKQDVELDGYEVICHDKIGNIKKYKLTADEVEEFQKNLKEDKNGNVYIGVDKFDVYAEASGSAGVPGFGSAGFTAGGNYGHSSSDEKSNSKMNQNEKGNTKSKNETGYSENGTSFKDGKLTYHGVKIHRQMYLPDQRAYIDACQRRLQKALDEYDTLSTGERARMCAAADDLVRNLSKFSARTVHAMMMSKLNQQLFSKPQSVLVGD